MCVCRYMCLCACVFVHMCVYVCVIAYIHSMYVGVLCMCIFYVCAHVFCDVFPNTLYVFCTCCFVLLSTSE